jgi:hypothetical protein
VLYVLDNRRAEIVAEVLSVNISLRESVSKEAELVRRAVVNFEILAANVFQ